MALLNFRNLFICSVAVRAVLLVYGIIQDSLSVLKYTDIDYYVFLDSLDYVWNKGGSPYQRDTFRYTPLLSYLMLPTLVNVHLGKLVFVLFDLLTGLYIYKLLNKYYGAKKPKDNTLLPLIGSSLWLLNPMVITISTRGNAESVMSFLIMLFLYLLDCEMYVASGLVYGLSIHFKIYPIIYAVPLTVYFLTDSKKSNFENIKTVLKFGLPSLVSLVAVTALVYLKFGYEFLEHTYIYHLIRSDHRHNFSVWNMVLYMEQMPTLIKQNIQQQFINNSHSSQNSTFFTLFTTILDNKRFSSFPQLLLCLLIPILIFTKKKAGKPRTFMTLVQVLTVQTMVFVHFNKVITSQYFIWYLTYLPFFTEYFMELFRNNKAKLVTLILVWVLSQAVWLYFGFLLEFKNQNCFMGLFGAGCVMILGNVYVIGEFLGAI